jgi:protein arginine N-methyltransferase 1
MYSLEGYGRMVGDRIRMNLYLEAMRRAIHPESVVVDIGCGPGAMTLYACFLGARRVYGIDPGHSISLARELARANGFQDRVEFIQNLSTNVTLPVPADVIVADLRGTLPLFGRSIVSLNDARQRMLAPGGLMIPLRDSVMGAIVECPRLYREKICVWGRWGSALNMDAARRMSVNNGYRAYLPASSLLAEPRILKSLDYRVVNDIGLDAEPVWSVSRNGVIHGLCLWFDSELTPGFFLRNAPGQPKTIYGRLFLPLEEPIAVEAGCEIAARIRADLVDEEYVWRWDTSVNGKPRFSQSTFYGMAVVPTAVHGPRPASPRSAPHGSGRLGDE